MKNLALVLAVFSLGLGSQPLWAITSGQVAELFQAPCRAMGIAPELALAIAQVESGLKPWTLNIAGRSFQFDSREQALAKGGQALAAGQSLDVGLMQINRWWLDKYAIPLAEALNPETNIRLGCWILREELNRHHDLRKAVGAYHSPKSSQARRYASQVFAVLKRPSALNRPSADISTAKPFIATARPAGQALGKSLEPRLMKVPGTSPFKSMKVRKRHE